MPLVIVRSPRLFVLRLSVTDDAGTRRQSWSMPAAPFGDPAWQLPTVAAHLARLRRTGARPTPEAFAAHLAERATGPVPVPQTPYGYDPLHDSRVSCWLDVHAEPAQGGEQWPRCSLAVLEQETGRCGWSRITRHRGAYAVITHTHSEVTAEAQRLADRMRTRPDAGTAAVREMADRMRDWTQRAHRHVKAEQTLIRAGQPRTPKPEARRSAAVLMP
jgi:hypothetical protein